MKLAMRPRKTPEGAMEEMMSQSPRREVLDFFANQTRASQIASMAPWLAMPPWVVMKRERGLSMSSEKL